MGENTKIEWATHTFNPWVGCEKVSPACTNCYAESWAKRTGQAGLWRGERRRTSDANWRKPILWNERTPGARVFCASLADVFEDREDLVGWRSDLLDLVARTPALTWMLLTKRPEVAADYFTRWPVPANAWVGTTVESQERADERIPHLLRIPARVRFLSCEPLLGPLNLEPWLNPAAFCEHCDSHCSACPWQRAVVVDEDFDEATGNHPPRTINWVIAGGESGPRARPSHPEWFRSLRDQCSAAGVPLHFKQWGEWAPSSGQPRDDLHVLPLGPSYEPGRPGGEPEWMVRLGKVLAGRELDGRTWDGVPT